MALCLTLSFGMPERGTFKTFKTPSQNIQGKRYLYYNSYFVTVCIFHTIVWNNILHSLAKLQKIKQRKIIKGARACKYFRKYLCDDNHRSFSRSFDTFSPVFDQDVKYMLYH